MKTTIYALIDPRTNLIRYIGKAEKVKKRFRQHLSDWKHRNMKSCVWIRELLLLGLRPILSVIEECEGDGCDEEIRYIADARSRGISLLNSTDGGEGCVGFRHSAESKASMSRQRKGVRLSEQHKSNIALAGIGRKRSRESVERGASKLRGRKLSPRQIESLRQANLGKVRSDQSKEKQSSSLLSRTDEERSEVTRKRMAATLVSPWTEPERQAFIDLRLSIGLTAKQLGEKTGVKYQTIHAAEIGKKTPRKKTMAKMVGVIEQLKASGYTVADAQRERDIAEQSRIARLVVRTKELLGGKKQSKDFIAKRGAAMRKYFDDRRAAGLPAREPSAEREAQRRAAFDATMAAKKCLSSIS